MSKPIQVLVKYTCKEVKSQTVLDFIEMFYPYQTATDSIGNTLKVERQWYS